MLPTQQVEGLIPQIQFKYVEIQEIQDLIKKTELELQESQITRDLNMFKELLKCKQEQESQLREQGKQIMLDRC